jgi:hypothetical protein
MKLVKSLLLGSAAGICAVAGAQAADLPMRKAAPVEYVRVCTAHGAGFFFIPGTDTCLRVGGRARFEYQYTWQNSRNSSVSGYRGLGRLNIDARTSTPYGTLRAFVRFEIASRTGGYLKSGSQERYANAFTASGQDTASQIQKYVDVDKAFVQFAGLTAGRAQSMYDFYAHDLEMIGASMVSDTNTNLLAYTATFGGGFSATISMEDPTYRRAPVFAQAITGTAGLAAGIAPASQSGVNFLSGATALGFVYNTAGTGSAVAVDVAQRNNMPDFIGALRYDGAWGSAQVSGAVHEIRTGNVVQSIAPFAVNGGPVGGSTFTGRLPQSEYGWAVQGGLKLNIPQLAPGDQIWLQGAYGQGAGQYTGINSPPGFDTQTGSVTNKFTINQVDAAIQADGRLNLTESWTVAAALLHYWTPEWRQAVFGSYGQANYDPRLRNGSFGPAGLTAGFGVPVAATSTTLMSYEQFYGGSNLIWSPVRDLDIGVEVVYQRIWLPQAVINANKPAVPGVRGATLTTYDDNILTRFRIQRDF